MTIKKGSVVHIADAEIKKEFLVTGVYEDGRCSLAYIGAMSSTDSLFRPERLVYVRDATDAEKRSTDNRNGRRW